MHFSLHLDLKTLNDFNITDLPPYSCFGKETFGIQSELNLSSHCSYDMELNRPYCVCSEKVGGGVQILFMQELTKKAEGKFISKIIRPF